jgi:hypothetical protein
LLFKFMDRTTGYLCPSYRRLSKETGYCRQAVGHGIARLERAGILRIVRRLCKQWVKRISPVTGQPEEYRGTTQATNLYSVHKPGAWADHLTLPIGRRAPFPSPNLLEQGQLTWKNCLNLKPSLPSREKPLNRSFNALADALDAFAARFQKA